MFEDRCDLLRSLHVPGTPLVLPNAWDAASAGAVVAAGFPVVATTSGGVAATLGYEDEEAAPHEEMFAAAARIVRSVDAPVTVDAEAGYGMTSGDLVDALILAGAAGCNLEDTDHGSGRLSDMDRHAERLAAIRGAADDRGFRLVINARIDLFLADPDDRPQSELLEEAVARARSYVAAGADSVYPILLADEQTIAAFVEAMDAPVNILAQPDAPPPDRLAALGVARISYGTSIHDLAMDNLTSYLTGLR